MNDRMKEKERRKKEKFKSVHINVHFYGERVHHVD
jgi:hypothetical protein